MLRSRVNVSQKVAALEALLERVQRNAAQPRPDRSTGAAQSPALAGQEAPADSFSDWAVSSISPVVGVAVKPAQPPGTAPYPVMRGPQGLTPPGPPTGPAKSPEREASPISGWPDIGPTSYPTLPGIAGPPQPRIAAAKTVPIAAPEPAAGPESSLSDEASEAVTVQAPELLMVAPAPPEPAAPAKTLEAPKEAARPDRSAVIRTLPGVGLEQGDEQKPEDKLAAATAGLSAKAPATTRAPVTPLGMQRVAPPVVVQPKASPVPGPPAPATTTPLPGAAKAPAAASRVSPLGGLSAKAPAVTPLKSPLVSLPKRPLSTPMVTAPGQAAKPPIAAGRPSALGTSTLGKPGFPKPAAPKAESPKPPQVQTPSAAKEAAQARGIEPPAAVLAASKSLSVQAAVPKASDSDDSMAATIDIDESPTARPHEVTADEMTKPLASVPESKEAERAPEQDTSEESSEEPTLMRPSPLDAVEALEKEAAGKEEEEEEGAEEPTLMRPSPLEAPSDFEQAATAPSKPEAAAPPREEQPAKAPGLLVLDELAAPPAGGPQAEAPLSEPLFSREIQPPLEGEEAARDTVRPERKPGRRAPFWGFALAAIALAGAGVVVAVNKGWVNRFITPAVDTAAPTATVTGVKTAAQPEPSVTVTATVAAPDAEAPRPETEDAGAEVADAGVTDASVSDAEAPDAAAAGAGFSDAAVPDAAAPEQPAAPEQTPAAPAGNPEALPEKKGYLTVTSAAGLHVYVQGAHAGLTNEALVVDCGPKFIRLGEPPATPPPPGAGLGAVKWRSEGKSVVVACRGTTDMALPATP